MEYDTFIIRFRPSSEDSYSIFASGPRGEAFGDFRFPFEPRDLENFILRVGRTRRGVRRLDSPEMDAAKSFGEELFEALFSGDVRDLYHTASAEADGVGKGLRLSLRAGEAPELSHVPWEYLCEEGHFLSVSERTPIVRHLDLKKTHIPLPLEPPFRIVGMVSSPNDVAELKVGKEIKRVDTALDSLISDGYVEMKWLERATLRSLLDALVKTDFHIFHYIGHGEFDERAGDGSLILEDERGSARRVSGMRLGQLLSDERSLRLAVLNTCEGARTDREDPFAGVAATLVKTGIPSVVAMQFEITDNAAILFAEAFYAALVRGSPIDAALAAARKAIWADSNDVEWGTPVLFMRVQDGRIFDVRSKTSEAEQEDDLYSLQVELEPSAAIATPGEVITWQLTITNTGRTPISEITAWRDDGSSVEVPATLEPGRRSMLRWRTRPKADESIRVTVSGDNARGDRITDQVSATVTVREDEPGR